MKLLRGMLRRPEADLGRLPVQLDLRAISLMEGVRAALAVAAIVALDAALRRMAGRLAALSLAADKRAGMGPRIGRRGGPGWRRR